MAESGDFYSQKEAFDRLARMLAAMRTADDDRVELSVATVGGVSTPRLRAYNPNGRYSTPDGRANSLNFDLEIYKAVENLRAVCYRQGSGTWFSMTMSVDKAGAVDAAYNYDEEPDWIDIPPADTAFAADQEKFPRDADKQPAWLKSKLSSIDPVPGGAALAPEQKTVQSEWQRLCSLLTADPRLLEAVTHPASYFAENAESLRARGIHDVGQATPWAICIDWLERNDLLVDLAPHESSLELQADLDSLAIVRGQGVDLSALGTELVPLPAGLAWADQLLNAAGLQILRLEDGRDSYSLVVVWQASAAETIQLAERLGLRARAVPESGTAAFGKQLVVGGIGARIAAFALDLVFLAVVANIGVGVGALINGSTSGEGGVIFTTLGVVGGVYLIGLIVTVGLSGWTPGLLCLGLRIVREDTLMRAGIGRALGRGVLLLPIVFWPWWVLLLVTAVRDKSGRHQGLHDSLSRTMVLNVRRGLDPR